MKFNVLLYNFSTHKVEHYNVIPYFIDSWNDNRFDKDKVKTKEDLKSWIKRASQYQFWARCQYESLLAAWPFGNKKMTDDIKKLIDSGVDISVYQYNIDLINIITQDMVKIDIHDQIMMNIDIVTDLLSKEFKIYG